MNVAWSVPRNRRPNPFKARLRSVLLIGTAGIAVLATTILSALGASAAASGGLFSGWVALLVTVAAVVVNAAVFIVAFRVATAIKLSVGDVAPGAIIAAVIWQLLQLFGTAYVAHVVKDANATYGVFAVVLGLLAWIFLAALGVVVSVEINVVRTKHLFPRALLTPFTDNVDLTSADQRAYTDAATAQRHKEFESVDVTFDHDGQEASARQRAAEERLAAQSEHVVRDGERARSPPAFDAGRGQHVAVDGDVLGDHRRPVEPRRPWPPGWRARSSVPAAATARTASSIAG